MPRRKKEVDAVMARPTVDDETGPLPGMEDMMPKPEEGNGLDNLEKGTESRKIKAPRDVEYWIVGLNRITQRREVVACFPTLHRLTSRYEEMASVFQAAYSNLETMKVKPVKGG